MSWRMTTNLGTMMLSKLTKNEVVNDDKKEVEYGNETKLKL